MVEDITALGESMKSLADANGMLQEEISNLLKEKKKLSKLYDKALSEKDDLIAAAKDRKKEISELKKQAKGENPAE
jgi:DNA repair exonuclease SbcCD ATPase subunit